MTDRDGFLATVRAALEASGSRFTGGTAVPGGAAVPAIERDYRVDGSGPPGSAAIVSEFVEALADYQVKATRVSADEVPGAIEQLLADAHSVVVPAGLDPAWIGAAGRGDREVAVDSLEAPVDKQILAEVEAVVTAARTAVSLTGAIALDGEADQGRRVISLLPDIHVCVVNASQVQATMPQAVAILAENPQRPTTWIAGASATSDIELVRVNGVHGPRSLRVVLVTDR